ncbi:hypothetical protein HCN44_006642 [Aphidius gifuensis]|uniref:MADF domain-containing protein n=1 Tax=Aphidius gifuensis TaxID=684658 RepID=A0A834XXV7_APHGI|nr:putative uncharacterized protein DDB_G0292292 [Aphidius gifuensis]KAF7995535.1 hypothetical protein HCN44_006642 [Aphidius gifuensis]
MKTRKIDPTCLIAEVYKRPALWNADHHMHYNRDAVDRIWEELSVVLQTPLAMIKSRWKGLRDTMRLEMKKRKRYKQNKQAHRPVWSYYNDLKFLRSQILRRSQTLASTSISDESNSSCITDPDNYESSDLSDDNSSNNLHNNKKHKSINNDLNNKKINSTIENKNSKVDKLIKESSSNCCLDGAPGTSVDDPTVIMIKDEHSSLISYDLPDPLNNNRQINLQQIDNTNLIDDNKHDDDDNYHFLVSLLPHMKKLTDERRMFLRMKIQELVYHQVYNK